MSAYRDPAAAIADEPTKDTRPVGPCDHCPACGERGGTFIVRTVKGDERQYRGPTIAIVCSDEKCHEAGALHLHQKCDTCKHRWTVLPVGPRKKAEEPIDLNSAPWRSRVVVVAAIAGVCASLAFRLLLGAP